MTELICANCHYAFSRTPYSPCKCHLCLDPSSGPVKSFIRKQQIIGYRAAMKGDCSGKSDADISKEIDENNAILREGVDNIMKRL